MNKRGIELSINFVVMLILGVAMLSGAFMLTAKLFGKATEYQKQVDANTQEQIKRMITDSNAQVIIYPQRIEVAKKKSKIVGVGVQNTLTGAGASNDFTLDVSFAKAYKEDGTELCNLQNPPNYCDFTKWLIYKNSPQPIDKNDIKTFPVIFQVHGEAVRGVYVFNVDVKTGGNKYGGTQKIYLRLP